MKPVADRPVAFRSRALPLPVLAVHAAGVAAASIVQQLLAATPDQLRGLQAVATAGDVVLLGPEDALPWADGVTYLGRDPRAPRLLLPTYYEASVPLDLLERRILACAPLQSPAPIAVLPALHRMLPVGHARRPDADALRSWLRGQASPSP